jgi:hypothetical protein
MHNKTRTKHKIILKLSTNDNESNARHKKTRKMKGGFFGLFNKSSSPPQRAVVNPSKQVQQPVTNVASAAIKTSVGITVINTLSTIVSTALGRPEVMAAVTGIAATSVTVASGGLIVIGVVVLVSAIFIVREKRKAYNGLILVMDELFLVLQKLSGIADVSMHIAETYGFPIDTRDVNIALNTILTKFDELLDPTTDYGTIKNDLANFRALKKKANGAVNMIIDDAAIRQTAQDSNNATTEPPLSLWTQFNNQRKQFFFSAPKFVEELNESVAYLALYVGAFSASFSTTYTTVVVQLLINNQMDELRALQAKVLNDIKFHSMLEGALVYPLLQSQKTRATCLNRNPASSCDPTFVTAAESMRLYMQKKFDPNVVGSIGSALYNKMPNLKQVVKVQTTLSTAADANTFADNVKAAFDDDRGDIIPALKPPAPPAAPPAPPAPAQGGEIEMTEFEPKTPATTAAAAPATTTVAAPPPGTAAPATTTVAAPPPGTAAPPADTDPLLNTGT